MVDYLIWRQAVDLGWSNVHSDGLGSVILIVEGVCSQNRPLNWFSMRSVALKLCIHVVFIIRNYMMLSIFTIAISPPGNSILIGIRINTKVILSLLVRMSHFETHVNHFYQGLLMWGFSRDISRQSVTSDANLWFLSWLFKLTRSLRRQSCRSWYRKPASNLSHVLRLDRHLWRWLGRETMPWYSIMHRQRGLTVKLLRICFPFLLDHLVAWLLLLCGTPHLL